MAARKVLTPNLTGGKRLQQHALLDHVSFTMRPEADRYLKQQAAEMPPLAGEQVILGSAIPEPTAVNATNPEATPFVGMVVSSGRRSGAAGSVIGALSTPRCWS